MIPLLIFASSMNDRALSDARERIQAAQQAHAIEVRAQHREVVKVQPESHLTAEEQQAHDKFKESDLRSQIIAP